MAELDIGRKTVGDPGGGAYDYPTSNHNPQKGKGHSRKKSKGKGKHPDVVETNLQDLRCLSAPGCCVPLCLLLFLESTCVSRLVVVGCRLTEVFSWNKLWANHGLPFRAPVYRGCPAWTHWCASKSRMTLRQRANPLSCWVESCCSVMVVFVFVVEVSERQAFVCDPSDTALNRSFNSVVSFANTEYNWRTLVHFKRGTVDHGCDNQFRVNRTDKLVQSMCFLTVVHSSKIHTASGARLQHDGGRPVTHKLPEGRTLRVIFHACAVQKPILSLGCITLAGVLEWSSCRHWYTVFS